MKRLERDALLRRLRRDAERIAAHFYLEYKAIEAERRGVKARYGACYSDGLIEIRLQHAKSGEPLKYSSLIDTLCHELAHLRHFDHGKEFKRLYLQILRWARHQGIYRPRTKHPHAAPPPLSPRYGPRKRNGVPVFADATARAHRPDWMTTPKELVESKPMPAEPTPLVPAPSPRKADARVVAKKPAGPQQLSLF